MLSQPKHEPYLSVVVATRNDDHGGDPLKRLQAFVNCFDAQCHRFGLDAEVIVVEWNPPPERPRVSSLLRLPAPSRCRYRFIDVPAELHRRLQFSDVLPLFQMNAKNVGIRRARGRFVLATNIDIIFSNELIERIAARQLEPGRLYRVDRHDIQSDFPVDASLEEQMAYGASHQLRVHGRWGTNPVDSDGRPVRLSKDVVDGAGVRLGTGWHVRESGTEERVFRWASEAAELLVDPAAAGIVGDVVLHLDIESHPYAADSWLDIEARDNQATLVSTRIAGRVTLLVPLGAAWQSGPRPIGLRLAKEHPDWRRELPMFERRDAMFYRIYSATLAPAAIEAVGFDYPLSGWTNANPSSGLTTGLTADGLSVTSDPRKWSYCVRYGPVHVPRRGQHRFDLTCSVSEGRMAVGVLSRSDRFWIPATVTQFEEGKRRRFEIAVDLPSNEQCSLVVFNDHPDGDGVTRFVIHGLRGTCEPTWTPPVRRRRLRAMLRSDRAAVAYAKWAARLRAARLRWTSGGWKPAVADRLSRIIGGIGGEGLLNRIARSAPEFQAIERALVAADQQMRAVAPLQEVADVHRFLRDRRPHNLHVNGCGDFQLMAREHWDELRGYPELETFSMNIDGLFSYIADAAGIREEALSMPIYHLEHEVGSGWSPEGEALLRDRIAQRGITWIDAATVYVWAAYMRWLQRPMIFNGSDWGLVNAPLVERTPAMTSALDA